MTGTFSHNSLSVSTFEALQLFKSAYHNGHIAVADDAAKHIVDIFDSSDADFISDSPSLEV